MKKTKTQTPNEQPQPKEQKKVKSPRRQYNTTGIESFAIAHEQTLQKLERERENNTPGGEGQTKKKHGAIKFTKEIGNEICWLVANEHLSVDKISERLNIPRATIVYWTLDYKDFAEDYARAHKVKWLAMSDSIMDVAKDNSNDTLTDEEGNKYENKEWINRSRLVVDTMKWMLSKTLPKIFGDKLEIESKSEIKHQITGMTIELHDNVIKRLEGNNEQINGNSNTLNIDYDEVKE